MVQLKKNKEQKVEERENMRGETQEKSPDREGAGCDVV